jgi:hypothetical protein
MNSPTKNTEWLEKEWYEKEQRMIEEDRRKQGKPIRLGRWICYCDENNKLIYEFVNM